MGYSANYEISMATGSLEKAALNERKPKGAAGGTTTKTQKLGVSVNIDSEDRWKQIQRWFPNADLVAKGVSEHDAAGLSWTCARNIGEINVKAHDAVGKELFEMIGASAGQPTLHISAGAKHARVTFQVEGEVPPEKARTIRDYYKADVLWGWANSQQKLPLNDGGAQPEGVDPKTPKRTGGRGKHKGNASADKAAGGDE